MPAVHETAYPRLKEAVTPTDLAEVYTPTSEEHALAIRRLIPCSGESEPSSGSPTDCEPTALPSR